MPKQHEYNAEEIKPTRCVTDLDGDLMLVLGIEGAASRKAFRPNQSPITRCPRTCRLIERTSREVPDSKHKEDDGRIMSLSLPEDDMGSMIVLCQLLC